MYKLTLFLLLISLNTRAQFITLWKTNNPGTSSSNQIIIPATGTNYTINWVEVDNPANNGTTTGTGRYRLTFPSPGTYQVSISKGSGSFENIVFNNGGDRRKLLRITQWGDTQWSNMAAAFAGCSNLTIKATDVPVLFKVTNMAGMFNGCTALDTVPNMNRWDVSRVVSMYTMFSGATAFNESIEGWDVSSVTDMGKMFHYAQAFNKPIEKWNTEKVKDMSLMFYEARAFNQTVDSLNVMNVTTMHNMFWNATAFNQPIKSWTVTNVTDMSGMFNGATAFNQPLENWKVQNVTDMRAMFNGATAFNQPIKKWNVSKVTNMSWMFYNATAFNQPLDSLPIINVRNMALMFSGATGFNQSLSSWRLSNVNDLYQMLNRSGIDCKNLTLTLQGWANNTQTPNNIEFGAARLNYASQAVDALATLRNEKNWTITIGNEVECATLDVSLIRFLAQHESGKVNLHWATASETDHDYFELERSADARTWVALTKLKGAGTVTTVQQYEATDLNPLTGTSYYRLKIVDLAGKAEYSNIRSVHITTPKTQYAYPNPAYTTITLTGTPMGDLKIYNILGQEVMQTKVLSEKTEIDIQKLPAGVYTIKMTKGWSTRFSKN